MDASPATHDLLCLRRRAGSWSNNGCPCEWSVFAQFVGTLNGVGQYLGSTYYAIIGTYGEASSGLNKWTAYNFNITNPALAARAMQEWRASETGKSAPGSAFGCGTCRAPRGNPYLGCALSSRAEYEIGLKKLAQMTGKSFRIKWTALVPNLVQLWAKALLLLVRPKTSQNS